MLSGIIKVPSSSKMDTLPWSSATARGCTTFVKSRGAAEGPDAGWAGEVAATIRGKSPTSLKIALAQMRHGRDRSFLDCMTAEFRIVSRIVYGHDFYEGIRAVIIDKDNRPRWRPATLAEVDDAEIARHFDPVAEELVPP